MTWTLRIPRRLCEQMRADLYRPHSFAAERVGVLYTRSSPPDGTTLMLAAEYRPMQDAHGNHLCPDSAVDGSVLRR